MIAPQVSSQPSKPPTRWLTILQLSFSVLAAVLLLGAGFTIAMVNIIQYLTQGTAASDPTQSLMVAASLVFAGMLALPSAWYAGKLLVQPDSEPPIRQERKGFTLTLTILLVVFVGGALLIGNLVSTNPGISWLLLPLLNLVATGLPALWVIYIGTHGLIPGKPSRLWGIFIGSLILSPLMILILELLLLVAIGIIGLLWIMLDPHLSSQLNSLAMRLQNSGANPEAILRIFMPFLLNPVILILLFAYISLLVPILEEVLKPMGIWFLAKLKITPAQGFAYGVLCGAGFGLFENLGNTAGGGETWVLLASARISTLLLHSLNTGLVGWALASAWRKKHYLRLGITFTYTVIMHGVWNGLAVLSFLASAESLPGISIPANLAQLGNLSAIGIVALGAFNLVFFIGFSNALRRSVESAQAKAFVDHLRPEGSVYQALPGNDSPDTTHSTATPGSGTDQGNPD